MATPPQAPELVPGERVRFKVSLGIQVAAGGSVMFTDRTVSPGQYGTVLAPDAAPADEGFTAVRPEGEQDGFVQVQPDLVEVSGGGASEPAT